MQETPVEKINKQLDILSKAVNDILIKEYIPSKLEARVLKYRNDVVQNSEIRSLKAQKYFNYCQQYFAFFKNRSYQFLFNDYSLGRFLYEFDENNHLMSYNLYWNPCPFSSEFISELNENEIDVIEYFDSVDFNDKIELNHITLRTPIRIDYDRKYNGANKEHHPLLHIHYQNNNTRAYSKKVFSVYGYLLFVLENCYPDIYQNKCYKEKVEVLRKLDEETKPWLKCQKNDEMSIFGQRIYTEIYFK